MAAIEYPKTLPGPVSAPIQSAERRVLSTLPGLAAAPMQRDRLAGQQLEFVFTTDQVAVWADWLENSLGLAGAWFASNWSHPQGGINVRRFIGHPTYPTFYPNVGWRVNAVCEVRGRGMLPTETDPPEAFEYESGAALGVWFETAYLAAKHHADILGFADVVMAPDLGSGWNDIDGAGPEIIEQRLHCYRFSEQDPADGFQYYLNRRPA